MGAWWPPASPTDLRITLLNLVDILYILSHFPLTLLFIQIIQDQVPLLVRPPIIMIIIIIIIIMIIIITIVIIIFIAIIIVIVILVWSLVYNRDKRTAFEFVTEESIPRTWLLYMLLYCPNAFFPVRRLNLSRYLFTSKTRMILSNCWFLLQKLIVAVPSYFSKRGPVWMASLFMTVKL